MGGSSGGGETVQTQQVNEPWSQQIPYLTEGFEKAKSTVLDRPLDYYPESTVIPFSPEREAGLNLASWRAVNGSPLVEGASTVLGDTLSGNYMDAGNPYMTAVTDRVAGDARAAVDSTFESGGRLNSGLRDEAVARGVGDAVAPYQFGAYENERDRQLSSVDPAMAVANEPYDAAQMLGQIGSTREGLQGEYLQEDINRFNFGQQEPTSRLGQYMGLVGGGYGGSSTGTQPVSNQGSITSRDLLGTGAMLGSSVLSPTVICTELHRQKFITDETVCGDKRFTARIIRNDVDVYYGYRRWADPVAAMMKKSRAFTWLVYIVYGPAVYEMAAQGGRGKGSRWGRVLLRGLIPFSRWMGKEKVKRHAIA